MIGPAHRVGVAGPGGAVGGELLRLLAGRDVEARRLGRDGDRSFDGLDVCFFATPAAVSARWAPAAVAAGALAVDCSSAFRSDPRVPLVVPEVNGGLLDTRPRLVASPNCATILLAVAVAPLHRAFGCERLSVTTFQALSGAGRQALAELEASTRAHLAGRPDEPVALHEPLAFNVFSHDSAVDPESGLNGEEAKIAAEMARLLEQPPRIAATCVRVPVRRVHCEAVELTLRRAASEAEVRRILAAADGVRLVDDRAANRFPTARRAEGCG
ncbi:MAG TPA: Asd/ArgC dimerization domain-containing protein, partial [Thermoanaerobaculia bacterium]|nr:Asd/ArgC dimerization domain-containing protein [Thermoanaerobaculia bacterium]